MKEYVVLIIVLFSSMMYIVSRMVLGMLRNVWKDKNKDILNVIYGAIFTGVCVSRSYLDNSSTLYVILFTYIIYEIFLMTTICKCYIEFPEIED